MINSSLGKVNEDLTYLVNERDLEMDDEGNLMNYFALLMEQAII